MLVALAGLTFTVYRAIVMEKITFMTLLYFVYLKIGLFLHFLKKKFELIFSVKYCSWNQLLNIFTICEMVIIFKFIRI